MQPDKETRFDAVETAWFAFFAEAMRLAELARQRRAASEKTAIIKESPQKSEDQ